MRSPRNTSPRFSALLTILAGLARRRVAGHKENVSPWSSVQHQEHGAQRSAQRACKHGRAPAEGQTVVFDRQRGLCGEQRVDLLRQNDASGTELRHSRASWRALRPQSRLDVNQVIACKVLGRYARQVERPRTTRHGQYSEHPRGAPHAGCTPPGPHQRNNPRQACCHSSVAQTSCRPGERPRSTKRAFSSTRLTKSVLL